MVHITTSRLQTGHRIANGAVSSENLNAPGRVNFVAGIRIWGFTGSDRIYP